MSSEAVARGLHRPRTLPPSFPQGPTERVPPLELYTARLSATIQVANIAQIAVECNPTPGGVARISSCLASNPSSLGRGLRAQLKRLRVETQQIRRPCAAEPPSRLAGHVAAMLRDCGSQDCAARRDLTHANPTAILQRRSLWQTRARAPGSCLRSPELPQIRICGRWVAPRERRVRRALISSAETPALCGELRQDLRKAAAHTDVPPRSKSLARGTRFTHDACS